MRNDDVPDSTDWLSTPLSGLAALENALRCQVCKDFYSTPMITSCCHTFCSLCIRRVLAVDSKCPLCRAAEQEIKLRSNWSMEEAVDAFTKARTTVLEAARNGAAARRPASPKRKAEDASIGSGAEPGSKRLRTSARLSKSRAEQAAAELESRREEEVGDSDGGYDDDYEGYDSLQDTSHSRDDNYVPEPDDGLVACPSCQKRMKDWQVFKHLESCPGPTNSEPQRGESSTTSALSVLNQAQRQDKKHERLAALNYSMLKDTVLRRKLWELGLDSSGPRSSLERRHKEWVTLWNANCDAAQPKSRAKLMSDLQLWERTQLGAAAASGSAAQQPPVKNKDFDGAAWGERHDSSFKDLIASARKSRHDAQKKAEEGAEPMASSAAGGAEPVAPDPYSSSSAPSQDTPMGQRMPPPVQPEPEINRPNGHAHAASGWEMDDDTTAINPPPVSSGDRQALHSLPPEQFVPSEFHD